MDIQKQVLDIALSARTASEQLALTSLEERNGALQAMASALREHAHEIVEKNAIDMKAAREAHTTEAICDRLMLDVSRIDGIAQALEDLVALPDPLGRVSMESELYNGIQLQRVSVPLGVVAVVFEARPNVGADAAGICIKSGNACILRGGSLAKGSNAIIARVLSEAAQRAGMPEGTINALSTTDRAATDELMKLHGMIDVLIPRGGAGLIQHCVEASKVPVIETGTGNCHVYIHESADIAMARNIIVNAKCRRYGVCNAAETLLVDEAIAPCVLPLVFQALQEKEVLLHCDDVSYTCAQSFAKTQEADAQKFRVVKADTHDWETEYLAPELAIKCVTGLKEAVEHINTFGTKHSEAIVAQDVQAADYFACAVDAAAVYVNASTAFTDGGQFGLGAEIGISTQKLHARGPFALDALTSYKYILHGCGQVRD